jgi:hypothetical protein
MALFDFFSRFFRGKDRLHQAKGTLNHIQKIRQWNWFIKNRQCPGVEHFFAHFALCDAADEDHLCFRVTHTHLVHEFKAAHSREFVI